MTKDSDHLFIDLFVTSHLQTIKEDMWCPFFKPLQWRQLCFQVVCPSVQPTALLRPWGGLFKFDTKLDSNMTWLEFDGSWSKVNFTVTSPNMLLASWGRYFRHASRDILLNLAQTLTWTQRCTDYILVKLWQYFLQPDWLASTALLARRPLTEYLTQGDPKSHQAWKGCILTYRLQ